MAGHTAPPEGLYLAEVFFDKAAVRAAREEGMDMDCRDKEKKL